MIASQVQVQGALFFFRKRKMFRKLQKLSCAIIIREYMMIGLHLTGSLFMLQKL
jgi:hypothetical protein